MKARDNPFRFERVTALAFRGANWDELWRKLEVCNHRGAIVGPHGSGKTTLLGEVAEALESRDLRVTRLFFNDQQRGLPADFEPKSFGAGDAIVADGPEHLALWSRLKLRRARPEVWVATAHAPIWLPTWIETSTSPQLLRELCAELEIELAASKAEQLWRECGGDVRAVFWRLYDAT